MVFLLQSHIKTKLRYHNRFVCRANWGNSHNSAGLHTIAFINLQLPWTAQLKLHQVHLPAAQSQQHWAAEAQAQKPLFWHSHTLLVGTQRHWQIERCYKSRRDHSCLRCCRKGLSFFCSTIHPSCLLFIRNNHNRNYIRVFSQHQCHSICLQMYCFSCSTYLWHFSTLPPHFCYKRVQTVPLTSFLKRNCCKPLYKPILVYSASKV